MAPPALFEDSAGEDSNLERKTRQKSRKHNSDVLTSTGQSPNSSIEITDDEDTDKSSKKAKRAEDTDQDWEPDDYTRKPTLKTGRGAPRPRYLQMDLEELREAYVKLKDHNGRLQQSHTVIKHKRANDRKRLKDEMCKRISVQKELKSTRCEIECLENKLMQQAIEHRNAFTEQVNNFANAERDLHAKIKKQLYPSRPDNENRDTFKKIVTRCKDWVKDWTNKNASIDWLEQHSRVVARCVNPRNPVLKSLVEQHIRSMGPRATRILVQAQLTQHVLSTFFTRDFELFDAVSMGKPVADELQRVFNVFLEDDKKSGLSWRAETIRKLRTRFNRQSGGHQGDVTKFDELRTFCLRETESLLNRLDSGVLKLVTSSEAYERLQELRDVFVDTAMLSLELLSQKSETTVISASTICRQPFNIASNLYEPHGSMGLDDDDNSCDGKTIHMVLTPAIETFGNSEGENLDDNKILLKALVIVFPEVDAANLVSEAEQQVPKATPGEELATSFLKDDTAVSSKRSKSDRTCYKPDAKTEATTKASKSISEDSALSKMSVKGEFGYMHSKFGIASSKPDSTNDYKNLVIRSISKEEGLIPEYDRAPSVRRHDNSTAIVPSKRRSSIGHSLGKQPSENISTTKKPRTQEKKRLTNEDHVATPQEDSLRNTEANMSHKTSASRHRTDQERIGIPLAEPDIGERKVTFSSNRQKEPADSKVEETQFKPEPRAKMSQDQERKDEEKSKETGRNGVKMKTEDDD